MNKVFDSKYAPLTVRHGRIHDYLGINLDYSLHDKVTITMFDYIEGFLNDIPSSLKGNSVTADPNHLFEVGYYAPILQPTFAKIYYHHVMQLLWLAKRIHPICYHCYHTSPPVYNCQTYMTERTWPVPATIFTEPAIYH